MFGDTINYEEESAKNKKGYLLYSPVREGYFSEYTMGQTLKTMILLLKK
jgi:hypothetical protein